MPKRKASATIQLKVRMKEATRARLERIAKSRGISLNSAVVSAIGDEILVDGLTDSEISLSEFLEYRDFKMAVRAAAHRFGADDDDVHWIMRRVRFGASHSQKDFDELNAAVREVVKQELAKKE